MEKSYLILLLYLFHFSLIQTINTNILNNIWKLEFNNGEEIILKPGVFKEIRLQLTSINNNIYFDDDKDISTIYKLSISDDNIISSVSDLIINPSEALSYSFYIGLKCQEYSNDHYIIKFNSSYIQNEYKFNSNLLDNDIQLNVKIDNDYMKIELEPMMKEMPGKSVNFFKLKKEVYNIDEIVIKAKNQYEEEIIINDIILYPFLDREEYSENNSANHGILFDYPFGTNNSFEEMKEYKFNLYIENYNESLCFKLNDDAFEININKEGPIILDEKIKKAILYNTEDQTSQYDVTNSIKIKTKIEAFPSILTCQFMPLHILSKLESVLKENNDIKIFKLFITQKNNYNIIVHDLETNTEYYSFCKLSNTDFIENERSKIKISIGNCENADKNIKLFPSIDENRIPQCVKFTFQNEVNDTILSKFNLFSLEKCYYHLKKNENLIVKGLNTISCQTIQLTSEYAIFCAAPLPLYNLGKFISYNDKEIYSKNFDEFINDIKINSNYIGISLNETEKIIDEEISQNSIKASLINCPDNNNLYICFSVLSTHKQPLQCSFNYYLTDKYSFGILGNSIYLFPNEKEIIYTIISNPIENKMYSLYFLCYNDLPYTFSYKTTGIMNLYTYYYNPSEDYDPTEEEEINIDTNTIINCNEKKNLLNPRCLKDEPISIIDKLMSDIPPILKEIENKAKQFSQLLPNRQIQYLRNIYEEFDPSSIKENVNKILLLEKLIELTKYLTYKDCSIYASGSSNKKENTIKSKNYTECRQLKQNYLENITNILKDNLHNFDCSSINNIITSELSDDIETNLKYILILIDELSNNPESYKKGFSSFLLDTAICLQENFENYWEKVEKQKRLLDEYLNSTILSIKKDLIYIMLQTLTNLAKIIYFDELDGYINIEKTKTGLILNEKYVKIQKKMIEFSKKFNGFGDELYVLSGSMFLKIQTNEEFNSSIDREINIINIPNKNMILKINSHDMLSKNKAETLQILVFDSPIVSIKASEDTEKSSDSVNTFISIILYDKNGKVIPIKNIDEKYRPEILYLKSQYQTLKTCFYYNEDKKELEGDGIIINENYEYNGKKYIKCASSHLTAFTAGTYNFNSKIQGWAVLIIVGGILFALIIIVIIILIAKKKCKKDIIDEEYIKSKYKKKEVLLY